jgi:hypothetical protein
VPRYHFNVHDGVQQFDNEGTELSDWKEARLHAIRYAGEIIKSDAKSIAVGEDWRIEVTNHEGLILFQLSFLIIEAPAILRSEKPTK